MSLKRSVELIGQRVLLKSWWFGSGWLFFSSLYFLFPLLEICVKSIKNQSYPLIYLSFNYDFLFFLLVFLRFGFFFRFFFISSLSIWFDFIFISNMTLIFIIFVFSSFSWFVIFSFNFNPQHFISFLLIFSD